MQQPAVKRLTTGQGPFFKQAIPKPSCLSGIPRRYSRYGISPEVFGDELTGLPRPDAVLVGTMMTYWYPAVFDCIKTVRETFPGVPVLIGGVYATLCSEHAKGSGACRIVRGPFDAAAARAVASIIEKPVAHAGEYPPVSPACELLSSQRVIPLLTSRGCPLRCPYCASGILYPDFQQRRPLSVADEIEYWHVQYGSTDFAFYDDALLLNPRTHIIPLLEAVIERGLQVRFHVPNGLHVSGIDERIACLMQRAGFRTLRLGLETADSGIQKALGSKTTRKDFIRAAQALKAAGFTAAEAGAYILACLPGQSVDSVRESISFVRDNGLRPYLSEFSPIPGTSFWPAAVRCSPFPIEHEPLFHNNTLLPCRSDSFTPDDLEILKQESRKK